MTFVEAIESVVPEETPKDGRKRKQKLRPGQVPSQAPGEAAETLDQPRAEAPVLAADPGETVLEGPVVDGLGADPDSDAGLGSDFDVDLDVDLDLDADLDLDGDMDVDREPVDDLLEAFDTAPAPAVAEDVADIEDVATVEEPTGLTDLTEDTEDTDEADDLDDLDQELVEPAAPDAEPLELIPWPHPGMAPVEEGGVAELPARLSAHDLLSTGQRILLSLMLGGAAAFVALRVTLGRGPAPITWGQVFVYSMTAVYVLVIGFKGLLVLGAGGAPVLRYGERDLAEQDVDDLPTYTILVPLHREERVLPELVGRLSALDYPAERLQILLLIEESDGATRRAAGAIDFGKQFEVVLIPDGGPKTKPKACNVGLGLATGEFCVIYDAEDRPDPDQLRKAVLAFRQQPDWVVCVQAELQYWNPHTNWMTRCFAAEYAVNFSLVLRGLDRFGLPIPLGGTSNHFRTDALRELGGWDPYNVTEDADLGMRIARRGWSVRMMTSVTLEEANSHLGNWLRQRSRWIKGYYQTWLVHMRNPVLLWRELGFRRFVSFQMTLGFFSLTTLINPVFWALTGVYLATGPDHIAALFPAPVLITGVTVMTLGNLTMVYFLMLGCMERGLFGVVRGTLLVPVYWALMSAAAFKALVQLIRPSKRHFWELTQHGLVEG